LYFDLFFGQQKHWISKLVFWLFVTDKSLKD